ncbi:MAG: DNA primase [Cellulomonadaceae bacterium]|nr:DNA primase [Cellulomonadaceae bacterium]
MPGLIRRDDVDAVRERARIEDIIGAQVILKPAGIGALKGLCPFHNEKTPSFNVRPAMGRYTCFGCGESGDVFTYLQKMDGLTFAEAVELLASQTGVHLHYEDARGGATSGPVQKPGARQRILEVNRATATFYASQLLQPEAEAGRRYLQERAFTRADTEKFGVGYAPKGWDHLTRFLTERGFTRAELLGAGVVKDNGRGGVYDYFRGRLLWPIRDATGAVVGFGARRLFDDDHVQAKFLNTPETLVYKKSQVLYGIDLAKNPIRSTGHVVVVEGYTDVMAAHLSGVETAVATCGTAFGQDHAKIIQRFLAGSAAGKLTFTFDGDAAGKKAAVRAYEVVRSVPLQLQAALVPDGMDPCDLRVAQGPEAVRALVDGAGSLASFVIGAAIEPFDLVSVEGRLGALRACAPVIAGLQDQSLLRLLAEQIAHRVGMDVADVLREASLAEGQRNRQAHQAEQRAQRVAMSGGGAGGAPVGGGFVGGGVAAGGGHAGGFAGGGPAGVPTGGGFAGGIVMPDPHDPVVRTERVALAAAMQFPGLLPATFDQLRESVFVVPVWRAIHHAIRAAGGAVAGASLPLATWVARVSEAAGDALAPVVGDLAVAPIPGGMGEDPALVAAAVDAVRELELTRIIGQIRSQVQRLDPAQDFEAYQALTAQLVTLESHRRILRGADNE